MNGNPPSRELAICPQRADPGTALKKRVRVYRPLSRAGVFGNLLLIVVTLAVALFLGTDQLPFSAVVVSLGIAIVLAGALAFIGSGWAMAGLVVLLFAWPIATRFVLVGAQLSIRAWFMGLIAGWTCGALLRRFADRGLTGRGLRESAVLRWWIRSKRFEQSAPTIAQLEAKITSLDGRDRSLVVLRDGLRQLEVCGDANGRMIVFLSEDVSDPSRWEVPKSGVVDPTDSVEIAMGDVSAPVAQGLTLSADAALPAARAFVARKRVQSDAGVLRGEDVLLVRPELGDSGAS